MKIIMCNLKNYLSHKEVLDYVDKMDLDLIFFPPTLYVPLFLNKNYKVGLQDVSYSTEATLVGENDANYAKEMGVSYVLLGHSKRRKFESDELINKKIITSLNCGLNVVLCIGEDLEEKKEEKLYNQIINNLKSINNLENLIIVYEPVWYIGKGFTPNKSDIYDSIKFIKQTIKDKFNSDIKVLYGGSVDETNIKELLDVDIIDGFLIGGSSINYEKLKEIIKLI